MAAKKSALSLGLAIVFSAAEAHRTETVRGAEKLAGSIHHPEQTEFAGQIVRVNADGTCRLVFFPPDAAKPSYTDAAEGEGPGTFRVVGA